MLNAYQTLIHSPFTWIAAAFALVTLVLTQVRNAETARPGKLAPLLEKLGLADIPYAVAFIGLTLWLLIFLSFALGLLYVMGHAVFTLVTGISIDATEEAATKTALDLRWSLITMAGLTATLGAIIALPFTIARVRFTARQTETAEQGHITDRINKAVEGLGADKTSYVGGEARTQPNLEVRIGAIYALERIAQDSPRDHVQIMEILCAYIRQNAPASEAAPAPAPDGKVRGFSIHQWLTKLAEPQPDIQTALTVLARRTPQQLSHESAASGRGYRLDLRNTNLQKVNLQYSQLSGAMLDGAHMQRANLHGAKLIGTAMEGSRLEGADLSDTVMSGVKLMSAKLDWADLWRSQMDRANLTDASVVGAHLREANLRDASLNRAKLFSAYLGDSLLQQCQLINVDIDNTTTLRGANFQGALLGSIDLTMVEIEAAQLSDAYGDASIKLPGDLAAGQPPLGHWQNTNLGILELRAAWHAWLEQTISTVTRPHSPPS